jgi:Protein of unknown function (DUF3807)
MPSTQESLLHFHAAHFPGQPPPLTAHPTLGWPSTNAVNDFNISTEESVLGYYADGVERTLTDDQIAIFRHTEIQELLRARRERERADAESADQSCHTSSVIPAGALFAERRDPSPRPWTVHDHESCNSKEKKYPGLSARNLDGRLGAASDQVDTDLDDAGQDLGQALSAEQLERLEIKPCPRRVIRYDEDGLAAESQQASSTLTRQAFFKPKFGWPELRH